MAERQALPLRKVFDPMWDHPRIGSAARPPISVWKENDMSILKAVRTAFADKRGAVTVDWVVLTAAVVVLSIGAISVLNTGIGAMIGSINEELTFENVTTPTPAADSSSGTGGESSGTGG
jgi:Flp pilus assembly pilin Flp